MKKKTAKTHKTEPAKKNVTTLRLVDLPFKTAKALKDAQDQIRLQLPRKPISKSSF